MKPTGIISILLIVVLTILFNMSANVVEASYEDADTVEEELRFPFNKELETVKSKVNNEVMAAEDIKSVSTGNTHIANTASNTKTTKTSGSAKKNVTTSKTTSTREILKPENKNVAIVEKNVVTAMATPKTIPTIKETKKVTKKSKSANKAESKGTVAKSTASVNTAKPVAASEEMADTELIEEVKIKIENTDATSVTTINDNTDAETVSTGEIIIEDVSIIETAAFLDGVDGEESVDLPAPTPVVAAMSESDRTFFNMYEAAKNSTANVEDKSSKFEAFIRPFKQLIISETGDANATIENIKIYDVYGKKVLEVSDLDLGGSAFNILPRGNYTIEVISGSAFHTAILSKL